MKTKKYSGFHRFVKVVGGILIFSLMMVAVFPDHVLSELQFSEKDIHKPTDDFSFIKRFICISDLFGEEQWTKEKGRTFDSTGVALTNGKRHPVNMCHYALFCYDEFQATGNEKFKNAFITQAKCLLDSGFYHRIDTDKIAYPYHIKFHDLKPPWYSALAQSEAISVLIRYYALTGDSSAIPVIIQNMNFMVAPQEFNCGTMSITPEGHEWYEEYPNSKQEKQVLNGFFLSVVALHEYSKLFPNNSEAERLYLNSIKTAKESFHHYDTGSWLKYNRGDKRLVSNGYMKWQILELKFLYELTGDPEFKYLMMLVASYTFNKPYEAAGCKVTNYDFSVPLNANTKGVLTFNGKRTPINLKKEVALLNVNCNIKVQDYAKLYDGNINSYCSLCSPDSISDEEYKIVFNYKRRTAIAGITVHFSMHDTILKPPLQITFKDSSSDKKYRNVKIVSVEHEGKSVHYYFDPIDSDEVLVTINKNESKHEIRIGEVVFTGPLENVKSDWWHHTTPFMKSENVAKMFSFDLKLIENFVVFYRHGSTENLIVKEKWKRFKGRPSTTNYLEKTDSKFLQFLIVCEPQSSKSEISNLKLVSAR